MAHLLIRGTVFFVSVCDYDERYDLKALSKMMFEISSEN